MASIKSSHLPSVQRDGQSRSVPVPFPFNFRAVAVLVRFQTVPVLSHRGGWRRDGGEREREGEREGGREGAGKGGEGGERGIYIYMYMYARSMTCGYLDCYPFTTYLCTYALLAQEGSRQFSDRDRARARAS